jgi:hypothetical protein
MQITDLDGAEDKERIRLKLKQQNAKTTKKTKLPCMKSAPA